MAKRTKQNKPVEQYTHSESKRSNNPHVGLVTPSTDPDQPKKQYSYDPRLDPKLVWSGKQEAIEFEVDTVSLHVHERIDPHTILEKVAKLQHHQETISSFFDSPENNPPLRNAIEFYKHDQNWSNRLIAGDSLLVMNSLLEKEGMEGKIQMIYIDPPYGIKYGSNFQPFVNKRDVKDGNDRDLTQEPEMIKAFRDTWELGIHSYLSYIRDRLLLTKQLLRDSGSCIVQISIENVSRVRLLMDEIFGTNNFVSMITVQKTTSSTKKTLDSVADYLLWYAKDIKRIKYHDLFVKKDLPIGDSDYKFLELKDGSRRPMTDEERINPLVIPKDSRIFGYGSLISQGGDDSVAFQFQNDTFTPGHGNHWKVSINGLQTLAVKNRISKLGNTVRYVKYFENFPYRHLHNVWTDVLVGFTQRKYVVQTHPPVIERIMLMTTDPGDAILDPTCGSGTTAYVAEKWGRRWITCDTSRIALALTKQRLMTAKFDYYNLLRPLEGVSSGFDYETVPRITLGSLANNEEPPIEILYDKPKIDKTKTRITGPFTVEAVPAPTVKSIDVLSEELEGSSINNTTISRQLQWRDELLKSGIRGKGGQRIEFASVAPHPATRHLHADAETKEEPPKRVMVSFGPEHAPLEQRQVALAIEEAQSLVPRPQMIVFASMQFDPEASKDIDGLNWPGVTVLKAEMNKDLLTEDLKKKRSTNESFWLMGQPDVSLQKNRDGKYVITVNGFDYYNTDTEEIESGDSSKIAMWMLDEDYDGRSLYPQQIFFPMEGSKGGWNRLAKSLKAQIDEELIPKYQGTESIPFEAGPNKRVAVKIIDDRGIESLKIIRTE